MIMLERLGGRNAYEVAFGHSVDISAFIQFEWWEPVYYLDIEDPSFPASKEKAGRFCGVASNCGDLLTFKIYLPSTKNIIHRSVLRSAANDKDKPNLRALNPNYSGDEAQEDDEDSLFSIDVEDAADSKRVEDLKDEMKHERTAIPIDSEIAEAEAPALVSREDMSKDDKRFERCRNHRGDER